MNLRHQLVWLISILFIFVGCTDANKGSTKNQKPQVVRQKIANKSAEDNLKQQTEATSSSIEKPNVKKVAGAAGANVAVEKKPLKTDPAAELLTSKQTVETYQYKSTLDPFIPLIKAEKEKTPVASAPKKKKRAPQTPLERIDLSQLTLTAVFRGGKRNMAMVEESTGKGYIVKKGMYIGLDGGRITEIAKDRILITEVSEDVMGKPVTIERELKLRQFSGE